MAIFKTCVPVSVSLWPQQSFYSRSLCTKGRVVVCPRNSTSTASITSSSESSYCNLISSMSTSSSWTCKTCTFINPPSAKLNCQICLSPSSSPPPPPSPSTPKWACKSCTFLNPYKNNSCEVCGTRAIASKFEDLTDTSKSDSSVGSVFFPLLRACKRNDREDDDQALIVDDQKKKKICVEIGTGFSGIKACDSKGEKENGGTALIVDDQKKKKICVETGTGFRGIKACDNKGEKENGGTALKSIKIMSYNVWFREDLEMHKRMKAIGELIQLQSPDVICFQEVTPNIYETFQQSSWWKSYSCSVSPQVAQLRPYYCMLLSKLPVKSFKNRPFNNSAMGRELCIAEVEAENTVVIATSHLESPCPAPPKWDQMYSKERVDQAKEAIDLLNQNPNVIFTGDTNWDEKKDGEFPLQQGWMDAWTKLRGGESGWTYDTKSNKMLTGNRSLQKRLDRLVCKMRDFKVDEIEMIGMEPIPGLTYEKKVGRERKSLVLPVLPSDHYGLLVTVSSI